MSDFIEDFYYGNIEPQERIIKQNKTTQKTNEDFDAKRGLFDQAPFR